MGRWGEILERCADAVEDPGYPEVHRWLEGNPDGKVIGHFQMYFPEEIVHAAGALPVKVAGAGSALQLRQADARIAAFVCSVVRTSLELGLEGRLDFLSAFFVPAICDAARHSCGVWARNLPELECQILYLPQNATSAGARGYLSGDYRRIAGVLEAIIGRRIRDEDLRRSIGLFNENRRLLRELDRVKRDTPWVLPWSEAYTLMRAGGSMPREEHNLLLREALALLEERDERPQDRIRVVFEGGFCEQPPVEMLTVIQEVCYVVDDDLLIGLRWLTEDVPASVDPYDALAASYLQAESFSPVRRDARESNERKLIRRIRETEADAAIIAAAKMCEPGLEEQVAYGHALDDEAIPHLIIEFEEQMTVFERMRMEVETFSESLLFEFT